MYWAQAPNPECQIVILPERHFNKYSTSHLPYVVPIIWPKRKVPSSEHYIMKISEHGHHQWWPSGLRQQTISQLFVSTERTRFKSHLRHKCVQISPIWYRAHPNLTCVTIYRPAQTSTKRGKQCPLLGSPTRLNVRIRWEKSKRKSLKQLHHALRKH